MRNKKEEGTILISVLLFLSLSALLVNSAAAVTRNHVIQLRQTQESYYARSMIELTTTLLKDEMKSEGIVEEGEVTFSDGMVLVERISEDEYEITAFLNNDFSIKKSIKITIEGNEEIQAENEE